eukprot:COSAG02_NODE_49654_length_325_cov_0.920354_1_plen_24_part_10
MDTMMKVTVCRWRTYVLTGWLVGP